jgi:hypothetical protein
MPNAWSTTAIPPGQGCGRVALTYALRTLSAIPSFSQGNAIEGEEDWRDQEQDELVKRTGDRQQPDSGNPPQGLRNSTVPRQNPNGRDRPTDESPRASHTFSVGLRLAQEAIWPYGFHAGTQESQARGPRRCLRPKATGGDPHRVTLDRRGGERRAPESAELVISA